METGIEIIKNQDQNCDFIKMFVEKLTQLEFTYFLGFSKYEHSKNKTKGKYKQKNYRNGFILKRIKIENGELKVLVPRDRFAKFSSNVIQKRNKQLPVDEQRIIFFKDQDKIDLSLLGELIRELTKIHNHETLVNMTLAMRDLIVSKSQ